MRNIVDQKTTATNLFLKQIEDRDMVKVVSTINTLVRVQY